METIVRECNYPNLDSNGEAQRFDADYCESVQIRKYLIASGDVVMMVRKMRATLTGHAQHPFFAPLPSDVYSGRVPADRCAVCQQRHFGR